MTRTWQETKISYMLVTQTEKHHKKLEKDSIVMKLFIWPLPGLVNCPTLKNKYNPLLGVNLKGSQRIFDFNKD